MVLPLLPVPTVIWHSSTYLLIFDQLLQDFFEGLQQQQTLYKLGNEAKHIYL